MISLHSLHDCLWSIIQNVLARGILMTLELQMAAATSAKLTKEDILLITVGGELVRNRTLIKERDREDTEAYAKAQLQLQKEAVEQYQKQKTNENPEEQPDGESLMQMTSRGTRDMITEFLEDSARYYQQHGSAPLENHPSVVNTNDRLLARRPSSTEDTDYTSALLEGAVSFVDAPEAKHILVFFSSDAPDPSDASEHQRLSDDLEQTVSIA